MAVGDSRRERFVLPETLNAVIPGLFALAGVLISGIGALVGYYLKLRHDIAREVRIDHFRRRLEIYERAYDFAAAIYQTGSRVPDLEEARSINKGLILVGSADVLRAFNRISDTSSEKLKAQGMSEQRIREEQTRVARDLFNAIRTDLYPHQTRLRDEDIRFIEPKRSAGTASAPPHPPPTDADSSPSAV